MSKPQSVVVKARKRNNLQHVDIPNQKEKTMKISTDGSTVEVDAHAEVSVNARVTPDFGLQFRKLGVATTLGLAAFAASLP